LLHRLAVPARRLGTPAIVARLALNAFDALPDDDGDHHHRGDRIGPPQVEECVEQETEEQNGCRDTCRIPFAWRRVPATENDALINKDRPSRICACDLQYTILGYIILGKVERMAHTTKDKAKLLSRVRRIQGQVEAIERALDSEHECSSVLQLMAACRGALNGLMAEVLEGHIRFHVLDSKSGKNAPQVEAAEELIDVVRTYLK
jgi:DNA-binding FrmR family transcriptional regulator